jgi:hypothetical protein
MFRLTDHLDGWFRGGPPQTTEGSSCEQLRQTHTEYRRRLYRLDEVLFEAQLYATEECNVIPDFSLDVSLAPPSMDILMAILSPSIRKIIDAEETFDYDTHSERHLSHVSVPT